MAYTSVALSSGDVKATIVPERGAIVTSLLVAGRDVLYLDESTLADPAKNVRGGIPVLFPYAGKLANETFLAAGTRMKQHGFGRNKPWAVRETGAGFVRVALVQDDDTRAQYPYDFEADYGVWLLPRGLQVELMVRNLGAKPLPISPGWHPYFNCPAAAKADLRGNVPGLSADKLGDDREFDFGLAPPPAGRARFTVPGLGELALSFSPAMRHMQFWSQPGKRFVCLEPFWGPNDTVNGEARLDVPPGEARELWMRIELE